MQLSWLVVLLIALSVLLWMCFGCVLSVDEGDIASATVVVRPGREDSRYPIDL
jgi:hypothetical protein